MKDFIYYSLSLTNNSKDKLLYFLQSRGYGDLIKALSKRIYLDHCTLLYYIQYNEETKALKERLDKYIENPFNKPIKITINAIAMTDKVFAFRVDGINTICANKTPHITISTRKGGKPVDSNYIKYWKPIEEITVETILEKI